MSQLIPEADHLCNVLSDILDLRVDLENAQSDYEVLERRYPVIEPTGRVPYSQLRQYYANFEEVADKVSEITLIKLKLRQRAYYVKTIIPDHLHDREFFIASCKAHFTFYFDNDELVIKCSDHS
jgi:hypothetical protein